ncbi:hypothetical protein OROHE_007216 [Orobanche hederae]
MVLPNDIDMLHPPPELEARKHKLKRLVPTPNSFFMDVKCQGCLLITTIFSHSQTVAVCANCQTVLCQSTGGKARLIEGCSFRKKGLLPNNKIITFRLLKMRHQKLGRGHEIEGQALSESNTSEGALAIPSETSFCSDIDGPCESYDFVDTYQVPDPYHPDMRHCRNAAETGGSLDHQIIDFKENVDSHVFQVKLFNR